MEPATSVYEAVAAPPRRIVCEYVAATDETLVTLEEVTTHVVTAEQTPRDGSVADRTYYRRALIKLHHVHLPKLADAAVLQYEADQRLVRPASNLQRALEIIQAKQKSTEDTALSP